jgi:hypothetical protein
MNWLQNLRLNAAAKTCARKLEPWLSREWGAADTYSKGQIDRAGAALRLSSSCKAFAYECFLVGESRGREAARERLGLFRPLVSSFEQPGTNEYVRSTTGLP